MLRVRAHIELLSSEEGGRSLAILGRTSYRPLHNFFGPDNREMANGSIELPEGASLRPGESTIIEIAFIEWPKLCATVRPGREWLIQEGLRVVGRGRVLHH